MDKFEETAFSLGVDQVSEPVLTEFGYHIIKLLEVKEAVTSEFDEIREKLDKDFRFIRAEELFVDHSAKLSEISYESADLEDPAAELGLTIQISDHFGRSGGEGIAASKQVVDAAFSEDLMVDKNNSDLIEIDPNHHVVIRAYEHQPSEIKPLTLVSEEIRDLLALQAARVTAAAQMNEMLTMLKGGSVTGYVADQFGLEWIVHGNINRNEMGVDAQIVREAFRLPRPAEGDKSLGASMLSNGDAAVITVTRVMNTDSDDLKESELRNLGRYLAIQQGQSDYNEYREALKVNAEITRNQ